MSLQQYLKVIDTPFAIVVGSVCAVLLTLQLGVAAGVLSQNDERGVLKSAQRFFAPAQDEQMALRESSGLPATATR